MHKQGPTHLRTQVQEELKLHCVINNMVIGDFWLAGKHHWQLYCDLRNEKDYYAEKHARLFVEKHGRDDSAIILEEFYHSGGLLWMQMNQQSIGLLHNVL